jgi:DNA-binding HxlR family transcriptional regulator
MVQESVCNCLCFAEGALDAISKKWTLLVINALGNHETLRYTELMKELEGISPKSLADTLAELCKQGLVQREAIAEIPPRVQYYLTKDGKQLRKAIHPLLQWALTRTNASGKCSSRYKNAKAHLLKTTVGQVKKCNRATLEKLSFSEQRDNRS